MNVTHVIRWPSVALAVALLAGCSSGGRMKEGTRAVEGFQSVKGALKKGQTQVDEVLSAMAQLNSSSDLKKSFAHYSDKVKELEKAGENASKRAESMRENVNAYIQKWQKEMDTLDDPSLRSSLAQRRDAVQANFAQVRAAADAARAAYQPFLKDLKDIQKALSIDLSKAALPGLQPAMNRATAQGQTLKQRISDVQAQLDHIQAGMSPTGKAGK